ncbi:MAG: BMP family lipoprotein [Fusobacteriaceae bacterium]
MKKIMGIFFLIISLSLFAESLNVVFFNTSKGDDYIGLEKGIFDGLKRAKKDFDITLDVIDIDLSKEKRIPLEKVLSTKNYNLVITDTKIYNDELIKYAEKNIDTRFVLIDSKVEKVFNITTIILELEKPAYLAGVMAAQQTKDKIVAFVGIRKSDVTDYVFYKFKQGVKSVNPDIKILTKFIDEKVKKGENPYESPYLGYIVGQELIDEGADTIYHMASKSGLGVIEAAYEAENVKVIGASFYQDSLYDGKVVVASIYPDISYYVYTIINTMKNDMTTPNKYRVSLENGAMVNTATLPENKNFSEGQKKYLNDVLDKLEQLDFSN